MPLSDKATFLIEYLDLPEAVGDPSATWEAFQIEHLNNNELLECASKSRQIGYSWAFAADAVADALLNPRTPHVFVSINLDEAAEKIRYARQIIESLDAEVRPRFVIDNRLELEFNNGSRLISHPCRPVRGKPKARVYLDEFAHYPKDREIYAAALPATTRGGYLRMASSPLGAGNLFWEIHAQTLRQYPGYVRRSAPWWTVRALCNDAKQARAEAPGLLTEARVRAFGTERIQSIFDNLPLEDFQQEYECAWVDEAVAWISWEEIKRNQILAQEGKLNYWQMAVSGNEPGAVDMALATIESVAAACASAQIEPALAAGVDVGRKRNLTEATFIGKSASGQLPYRLGLSLAGMEFDDQRAILDRALAVLPITTMLIDRNGLGMQLAEQLQARWPGRAEGVDFTNASKELWSVEAKVRFQKSQVPIPLERELSYQIHSIKKKVTAAKNAVFDTEGNEKHHADKYWALALAIWAGRSDNAATGWARKYR